MRKAWMICAIVALATGACAESRPQFSAPAGVTIIEDVTKEEEVEIAKFVRTIIRNKYLRPEQLSVRLNRTDVNFREFELQLRKSNVFYGGGILPNISGDDENSCNLFVVILSKKDESLEGFSVKIEKCHNSKLKVQGIGLAIF